MYAISMTAKSRLSVTVDADLIAAKKAEHDRRLRAIDDFIADYEAEQGEITEEEMEAAVRSMRARAIVVRGGQVVDDKGTG